MKINKYKTPTNAFLSLITLAIYIIYLLQFLKSEVVSISKVAPLYILIFIFIILSYSFLKELTNKKQKVFFGLVILLVQLSLGIFCTVKWMEPRSDYLISNQLWLTHLRILTSLHYIGGILPFLRILFNRI